MAEVLAEDAKVYYNSATYGSPTWVEIDVKNLTLSLDKGEADVTTRGSGGWNEFLDGLIDATVDFQLVWDTADAAQTAIRSAFTGKTGIEVLVLDGSSATNGSQGIRMTCMVKTFSRNEQLGEALMVDVSLRPRKNADAAPAWHTVSA